MEKENVIAAIRSRLLVAVIRARDATQARRITDACVEGGITCVEITFTIERAHKLLEQISAHYRPEDAIIGAGTVLDAETARIAILSGANFVVSPHFSEQTQRLCNRYRVACIPGIMSVGEAVAAMEGGADILKVFPANLFGPQIIPSILGPLPQARLMPTGGVDAGNAAQWLKAGAVALGIGSSLTSGADKGDYAAVTQAARELVSIAGLAIK